MNFLNELKKNKKKAKITNIKKQKTINRIKFSKECLGLKKNYYQNKLR